MKKLKEFLVYEKQIELPEVIYKLIEEKNYLELDKEIEKLTQSDGQIFLEAKKIRSFQKVEHLISLRSSPDEDGIWHDDGSRVMAFGLSLILNPEKILGGELEIRRKGHKEVLSLKMSLIGTLRFFPTGIDGFEHRVRAVTSGNRLVAAGWFS